MPWNQRNLLHGSPSGLASGQAPVSVHGVEHLLNSFRPVRMGEDPELLLGDGFNNHVADFIGVHPIVEHVLY